jgi:mono/diheme cytochrome c family protein
MFRSVIATIVFILAFVLIALSVLFVALSGGPKGARASLQSQSKGGRRAVTLGLGLLTVATLVAIPGVVMAYNANTQSKQAVGGVKLSHAQREGRQVFAEYCSTCHTLRAANAVGKVGPNLDVLRPPAALVENAIKLGRAAGNGSMPVGLVSGQQAEDVASFVAVAAGR